MGAQAPQGKSPTAATRPRAEEAPQGPWILYKIQNFWIFGKIRRYGILMGTVKIGVKNHPHLWGQINFSSIF